jgi:WD40 repeat protein
VGDSTGTVKVWEVRTGTELRSFEGNVKGDISRVAFSDNGKLVAAALADDSIKYWNIATQQLVDSFASSDSNKLAAFGKLLPRFSRENTTPDDIFQFRIGSSGKVDLYDRRSDKLLASLIALDDSDWVVTTPNGFFDTNKPLDNIQGLQWVISDEPMMPRPLDLFMRQYYQPGLLSRLMHCTRDRDPKACDREFPRVPAIGLIDRSRPTVSIGHQ